MMLSITNFHHSLAMLAFFQRTQLSLFERFLTQAVAGINSTSITSGMQNAAYVVLLIGFLWQVYQSALHGGDVRGLGTSLIKYVVTGIVVMNYGKIFTTVNQGFVNAGIWVNSASGYVDLFQNWSADLRTQFNQVGFQKLWGLITGDLPGLLDAILILVAYLLYPIVIVIFGFFYIFYGSVLYIFGPIVVALMPLGAANRIAKSCREHLHLERMARSLRWLRGTAERNSDGPTWADVKPKQLSRRARQPRRLLSDWTREHHLFPGDRRHSFHREAHRQRRYREYGGCDGRHRGHCPNRGRCRY
jgi:hypothetical protein